MNNEPVAIVNTNCENNIQWYDNNPEKHNGYFLYTHPVKEDEGKVCARCGAIAYDPVITQTVKELTDEEINKIYLEKYDGHMGFLSPDEVRDFARAILRKAQEK